MDAGVLEKDHVALQGGSEVRMKSPPCEMFWEWQATQFIATQNGDLIANLGKHCFIAVI